MGVDTFELLVHPVRLRIVHALSGGAPLTTAQLCARLPDVSQATVYRHVSVLTDAGVLAVDGEQRVRGAVERSYRLHREKATIDAATAASAGPDEHRQVFAVAMATLIAEFNAYLDHGDPRPAEDLVGYRQHAVWLSHEELEALITDLRAAILPRLRHEPTPGRRQHLLSPILFPTAGGVTPPEHHSSDEPQ
jgi:DNA-binding transcriptional ArsR family regulator